MCQAEWCAWAEACLDRAEIADLVLRMPTSPLLPADSHDDTDFEVGPHGGAPRGGGHGGAWGRQPGEFW